MFKLVSPHGGKLTPVLLPETQRTDALARVITSPTLSMTSRETSDLLTSHLDYSVKYCTCLSV